MALYMRLNGCLDDLVSMNYDAYALWIQIYNFVVTQLFSHECGLQCLAAFVVDVRGVAAVGLHGLGLEVGAGFAGHYHLSLLSLDSILRLGIDMRKVLVSQLTELHHSVQVRVVSKMTLEDDLLPDTEVARVNGNSAVFTCSALSDIGPVSFLFAQVETGRIGEEDPTEDETWNESLSAAGTPM